MPDAQGNYLGDHAGVLPSSENVLLHFSNQFQQREQQRRAAQAATAKAEEQRRIDFEKYWGTKVNSPEFKTNATQQGIINSELEATHKKATDMLMSGGSTADAYSYINQAIPQTSAKGRKYNELDKNLGLGLARILKEDPTIDANALIVAARTAASYKGDQLKDPSEIDPEHDWITEAYDKTPELFHTANGSNKALDDYMNKNTMAVSDERKYNKDFTTKTPGFEGKLPAHISVVKDANGDVVYENGQPKLDVTGASNYRMGDAEHDFIDENGKNVKQIPESMWETMPRAIKAPIIKQMKAEIDKANAVGGDENKIDYDSDYAKMLTRNIAYQTLNGKAKGYKFKSVDDKGPALKHAAFSEGMQAAHLAISKANLGISQQRLALTKAKQAAGGGDEDKAPEPLTDKYAANAESLPDPVTGKPSRYKYVNIKNVDKGALDIIAGTKYNAAGEPTGHTVEPYDINGEKYFLITDDGDWHGKDNQIVSRPDAYTRQLKFETTTTKKKSLLGKFKDAVLGAPKNAAPTQTKASAKTTKGGAPIIK